MKNKFGQTGRHYHYEPTDKKGQGALEFWAENGLICLIDERYPEADDRHFNVLTIREFLVNLQGINASIERCASAVARTTMAAGGPSPGGAAAEEREALHRLVANGISCAREAQTMGDPANPKHLRDMIKARRKQMLLAGVPDQMAHRAAGRAISQSIAPEAKKLPPLGKGRLIIP